MAIVDRKISSLELRQSTRSKLLSSKLVESKSIVKKARRKSERRYFTNTDYLNSQDGESPRDVPSKSSKRRKTERDTTVRGVSTRRSKGKVVLSENDGHESESDWLERVHGMRRSPIVTSQGYHLYTHLIIESNEERDVFTVGDHVMVCLSDGGERPAQITAFLYDPEEDLQGVELRWFYSEHDLLDLGKIIDKSKLPQGLFAFEEEFLESDKCEVLEASVIKRMIRIWNVKREYLRWSRDYLGIYSGPQRCSPGESPRGGERQSESRHHDERLEDYIREFNADLPHGYNCSNTREEGRLAPSLEMQHLLWVLR
ncbi:ORC/CDC6 like AAA+ ATPase [Cryptosporidium canis]|uniref:ORC/CDC6 like AAA+ ATPase n=1 Tax=Cryptosporidium canis TaxID=195482 RepID=A0A9D5DJS6_9CRYT|nr:ORC/CDC6 like AAA+ ATPase [Cryptosporidium canis]